MPKGTLTVVGTGIESMGQLTPGARREEMQSGTGEKRRNRATGNGVELEIGVRCGAEREDPTLGDSHRPQFRTSG